MEICSGLSTTELRWVFCKVQNWRFLWQLLVQLILARLSYRLALLGLNINVLFWKEQWYPSLESYQERLTTDLGFNPLLVQMQKFCLGHSKLVLLLVYYGINSCCISILIGMNTSWSLDQLVLCWHCICFSLIHWHGLVRIPHVWGNSCYSVTDFFLCVSFILYYFTSHWSMALLVTVGKCQ